MSTIVLLHGLGRSPLAMRGLARFLSSHQYHVINQGYASRRYTIAELCQRLFHDMLPRIKLDDEIHFVTHSMGGILLRYGLFHWQIPIQRLGKAVMLAPPSQGSEVVDTLKHLPFIHKIMGPAFMQLGTDDASVPNLLLDREQSQFPLPVGVIAGKRSYEPWFSPLFNGDNDGKVSVSRSQLPGMQDFCVMNVGHTFIMDDPETRQKILCFLRNGSFQE